MRQKSEILAHSPMLGQMKGGNFKMERRIILWVVIGALFLFSLYFAFQAGSTTGQSVSSASSSGSLDTTGWTENEIMNYEMHGTIPARVGSASTSSSGGMVGGC